MAHERGTSRGRFAVLVALLAAPLTAAAEETQPAAVAQAQPPATANPPKTDAATPPVAETKPPKWYDEIQFDAFVSAGYVFNTNEPANRQNTFHVFDPIHNTFALTDAELTVQRPVANPGDVGFRADFDLGGLVPPNTSLANNSAGPVTVGQFNVRQAYASVVAPIGAGLRLDVGKFVTHTGYEVIEGWDNYNDNISRSFLFGFAIPFTHVGARVSYTISPVLAAMVMVANGWDADVSRTKGKMIGAQLTLTPIEPLSIILNYCGGYEPATSGAAAVSGQQFRQLFDAVATVKLASWLSVGGNFDYGWQDSASVATPGDSATWWGGAGYLRVESPAGLGIALRGEYFKDNGGTRLTVPVSVYEGTVTPYWRATSHFMIRAEGRVDASDTDVYTKSDGTVGSTQPTVALNALFAY
jgi:Putative beta-barrel porin-2, OmpL-like. bbp2